MSREKRFWRHFAVSSAGGVVIAVIAVIAGGFHRIFQEIFALLNRLHFKKNRLLADKSIIKGR